MADQANNPPHDNNNSTDQDKPDPVEGRVTTKEEVNEEYPPAELFDPNNKNAKHIRCSMCDSSILKPGVATFIRQKVSNIPYFLEKRETDICFQSDLRSTTISLSLFRFSRINFIQITLHTDKQGRNAETKQVLDNFWQITNMMDFENIGFSHTVDGTYKYLTCADCERSVLGNYYWISV